VALAEKRCDVQCTANMDVQREEKKEWQDIARHRGRRLQAKLEEGEEDDRLLRAYKFGFENVSATVGDISETCAQLEKEK